MSDIEIYRRNHVPESIRLNFKAPDGTNVDEDYYTYEAAVGLVNNVSSRSRWAKRFGTPGRTAQTLFDLCKTCKDGDCSTCKIDYLIGYSSTYKQTEEWLREEE